ncbi:MAG: DUF2155 domain-containing protein [Rhodobacteraceae bacterium]|nr:DUF2155 domain-containing protein [Paracoccaceae bacterium]
MIRALTFALLCLGGAAAAQTRNDAFAPAPGSEGASGRGAVLRGLDKVNGHTADVEIMTGQTAEIFGLDVALGDCRYPADNPTGDAFAYLTIWEHGANDWVFDGWMVASSPALSALDHRRYDVWVLHCITS